MQRELRECFTMAVRARCIGVVGCDRRYKTGRGERWEGANAGVTTHKSRQYDARARARARRRRGGRKHVKQAWEPSCLRAEGSGAGRWRRSPLGWVVDASDGCDGDEIGVSRAREIDWVRVDLRFWALVGVSCRWRARAVSGSSRFSP